MRANATVYKALLPLRRTNLPCPFWATAQLPCHVCKYLPTNGDDHVASLAFPNHPVVWGAKPLTMARLKGNVSNQPHDPSTSRRNMFQGLLSIQDWPMINSSISLAGPAARPCRMVVDSWDLSREQPVSLPAGCTTPIVATCRADGCRRMWPKKCLRGCVPNWQRTVHRSGPQAGSGTRVL